MKFVYSVVRSRSFGVEEVFVPESNEFREAPLSHGMMKLGGAIAVSKKHSDSEIVKLMIEDAKGLPCCVRANDYPNGIIE